MPEPSRDAAWELLCEYTKDEALRRHALAVEAAMRSFARAAGEDEEAWGLAGLLHDFDYERYPTLEDHPRRGAEILREKGWPEPIVEAILGHGNHTGVPRRTAMARTLHAVDELCGFIFAVTFVRPSRSVMDLEPKSVIKKMKEKGFARAVSREDIREGAEELGIPLEDLVRRTIEALRPIAGELGLAGGS